MWFHKPTCLNILFLILSLLPEGSHSGRSQECTTLVKKKKLQIVFVIETVHQKIEVVRRWVRTVVDAIAKEHENTEFALTSFADYPGNKTHHPTEVRPSDGKGKGGQYGTDPEGCYKFHSGFGVSKEKIHETINKLDFTQYNTIDSSSCITAILFTAADKRIKWDPKAYKVIVFATTNMDSIHGWVKDKVRQEPKGDGNDKCATHRPPKLETVKKVLKEKKIDRLIGFTGVFSDAKEIYKRFSEHLKNIDVAHKLFRCPREGFSVEWDSPDFVKCTAKDNVPKEIGQYIGTDIEEQICNKPSTPRPVKPTGPTTEPDGPTGPPGAQTDKITVPTILCKCDEDNDVQTVGGRSDDDTYVEAEVDAPADADADTDADTDLVEKRRKRRAVKEVSLLKTKVDTDQHNEKTAWVEMVQADGHNYFHFHAI